MLQRAASNFKPPVAQGQDSNLSQRSIPHASTKLAQSSLQAQGPLQPSKPSSSNRSFRSGGGPYKNPLKRTSSEASSMSRSYSTSSSSGVLNQLHADVWFDENDFVNDEDLNFDDDDSPVQARKSASAATEFDTELYPSLPNVPSEENESLYPPLPPPKKAARLSTAAPVSSTPLRTSQIQWSSSPIEHKGTPPNAHLLRRKEPAAVDLTQDDSPVRSEEEKIVPKKRSRLPWTADEADQPKSHVDVGKTLQANYSYSGGFNEPAETPRSKITNEPTQAWNKTESAIKKLRKEMKKRQEWGATKDMTHLAKDIPASQETIKKTKSNSKKVARIFLSEEQKSVLDLVVEKKKSVFFTGSAGTGKSVLMREIIQTLKTRSKESDRIAVTASTGLAACNIGGVTLHSFAGIGLGKEPVEQLVKKIKRNSKIKQRWQRTKVLIIDEISMVDGDLFDKLENVARIIRGNGRPFGGIQLVVTGDFFQLPPVPDYGKTAKFSFDANTWNTCIQHTIGLTHVYRQRDEEFAAILNEMRLGLLSAVSVAKFRALARTPQDDSFIDATDLYPTRKEVYEANAAKMRNLSGEAVEYIAVDGGTMNDVEQRTKLLNNCMAEEKIILKKGAQVMLIKNLDDTLVNGSIGRIIAFMDEKTYDVYHESSEDIKEFERDLAEGGDAGYKQGRAKLKSLMNNDNSMASSMRWPLVRFKLADGTSRDLLCNREVWKVEQPNGEIQAQRNQVPLILAWALSIHKAQGQTLERVRVNLQKIFEKGQAYVALSRATTREGLQILNFDPKKVQAHPKVTAFYKSLYSVAEANGQDSAGTINVKGKSRGGELDAFLDDEAELLAATSAHF